MLRRTFLRVLAAIPALPFVGRAKAKPSYEYRVVPMTGSRDAKTGAKICPVCGSILQRGAAYRIGCSVSNGDRVERLPDWCNCDNPSTANWSLLVDAGARAAQRPRGY